MLVIQYRVGDIKYQIHYDYGILEFFDGVTRTSRFQYIDSTGYRFLTVTYGHVPGRFCLSCARTI